MAWSTPVIAAFDTGIGSGSLMTGWIIGTAGFRAGFGVAAALSALAIPYFFAVRLTLPKGDSPILHST